MFTNLILNKIYKYYTNFFSKPDSILEPMTCIIRLAILDFKPDNTKISITNNKIKYCDPTLLQGTIRWTNGDNREDIHNIYNPIIKALEWYDLEREDIRTIFEFCIKGLERLKNTYEPNSTISHSLEYYINYIKSSFGKKSEKVEEKNTVFLQLKNLWSDREIDIIKNLLLQLDECKDDSLIQALNAILSKKENIVSNIILNTTTKLE